MRSVLELLWIDSSKLGAMRALPAWRELLARAPVAARHPPDVPGTPVAGADPHGLADALAILVEATPLGERGVGAAVSESIRRDGKFVPSLVAVRGELAVELDALESLRAAVTNAVPFITEGDALGAAVEDAKAFLALPGISATSAGIDRVMERVLLAFGRVRRAVPPTYLEEQARRVVLERRAYGKRVFAGSNDLCSTLTAHDGSMRVFLPESAAACLPLAERFGVKLLAEAHLVVDRTETHAVVLRAIALARIVAPPE